MGRGYREAGRARSKKTPAAIICERHRSDSSATYVFAGREIGKRGRALREIAVEFHDDNQIARRGGRGGGERSPKYMGHWQRRKKGTGFPRCRKVARARGAGCGRVRGLNARNDSRSPKEKWESKNREYGALSMSARARTCTCIEIFWAIRFF